jgi:hypothetical protein
VFIATLFAHDLIRKPASTFRNHAPYLRMILPNLPSPAEAFKSKRQSGARASRRRETGTHFSASCTLLCWRQRRCVTGPALYAKALDAKVIGDAEA